MEEAGRGWNISHREQLPLPPHFWPVYKVALDFANMQREGAILASFVKFLGSGPLIQMLLEHRFWLRFVYFQFLQIQATYAKAVGVALTVLLIYYSVYCTVLCPVRFGQN